jgi:hypothetical protein
MRSTENILRVARPPYQRPSNPASSAPTLCGELVTQSASKELVVAASALQKTKPGQRSIHTEDRRRLSTTCLNRRTIGIRAMHFSKRLHLQMSSKGLIRKLDAAQIRIAERLECPMLLLLRGIWRHMFTSRTPRPGPDSPGKPERGTSWQA